MKKKILISIALLILGAAGLISSIIANKKIEAQTSGEKIEVLQSDNEDPRDNRNQSPQNPATTKDLIQGKENKDIMDTFDVDKMLEGYEIK